MYMSLKTISRVTLLHLSLNPLLSIPVRASTPTSILAHAQSPNLRSFSGLYPLCPSYNLYQDTIHNYNQEHSYSTSTTMSSENENQNQQSQEQEQEQKPVLALPEAGSDTQTNTLDLSAEGSTVKLDHLGPLVVNQDGTLSRISNWGQMTEIEQRNTLRVLGKRNKSRMEALKKAAAEEEVKAGEGN